LLNHLIRQELSMAEINPLRRRMIDDMMIRNLSRRRSNPTSMRLPSSASILGARPTGSGPKRCAHISST
jgi:hypothetical protein